MDQPQTRPPDRVAPTVIPAPAPAPAARLADSALRGDPELVPIAALRSQLAGTLGRVRFGGERLVLTTHGTPVAAVVGLDDLELLRQVDIVGIQAPQVQVQAVLSLSEADLWRALVDPRYRAPWWSVDTLDAIPGEPVRERWLTSDDRVVNLRGEVSAVEMGRCITLVWRETDCARPTTVELRVGPSAEAGGSELTVTETGFTPREEARACEHQQQWAEIVGRLADYLIVRAARG